MQSFSEAEKCKKLLPTESMQKTIAKCDGNQLIYAEQIKTHSETVENEFGQKKDIQFT